MRKYFFAVSILVLSAAIVFVVTGDVVSANYSTSYEVNPQVNVPLKKSEQTQIAEVFERVMLRYQDLLEKSLLSQKDDLANLTQRLDRIEAKLDNISRMLERMQGQSATKSVKKVNTPIKKGTNQ